MPAVKIATSVPAEQFRKLEAVRKQLGLKRSAAVQEALALWLAGKESAEGIQVYLRGYMNLPEDAGEATGIVEAWATGMEAEDW